MSYDSEIDRYVSFFVAKYGQTGDSRSDDLSRRDHVTNHPVLKYFAEPHLLKVPPSKLIDPVLWNFLARAFCFWKFGDVPCICIPVPMRGQRAQIIKKPNAFLIFINELDILFAEAVAHCAHGFVASVEGISNEGWERRFTEAWPEEHAGYVPDDLTGITLLFSECSRFSIENQNLFSDALGELQEFLCYALFTCLRDEGREHADADESEWDKFDRTLVQPLAEWPSTGSIHDEATLHFVIGYVFRSVGHELAHISSNDFDRDETDFLAEIYLRPLTRSLAKPLIEVEADINSAIMWHNFAKTHQMPSDGLYPYAGILLANTVDATRAIAQRYFESGRPLSEFEYWISILLTFQPIFENESLAGSYPTEIERFMFASALPMLCSIGHVDRSTMAKVMWMSCLSTIAIPNTEHALIAMEESIKFCRERYASHPLHPEGGISSRLKKFDELSKESRERLQQAFQTTDKGPSVMSLTTEGEIREAIYGRL